MLIVGLIELCNKLLSGPVMVLGALLAGAYLSKKTGFVQIKRLSYALKHTISQLGKGKGDENGITPFQAVATALSGTLGTGNIAGVATALAIGGAGSIFWMWVSAFFGMATKYSEIVLAMKYRKKTENGYVGGAMYYIKAIGEKNGRGKKASSFFAAVFAVLCLLASFCMGNMTQSNTAAAAITAIFPVNGFELRLIFFGISVLICIIMLGGVKRIASITAAVTPFMALFYICCCLVVIGKNITLLPDALSLIITSAFTKSSAVGGLAGYGMLTAVRIGFSRGVFTNEAGIGSAPIAHAAAQNKLPALQGLWGIFEVFFDTIVMCTMTALVIIMSKVECGGLENSATWTMRAFENGLGGFAGYAVGLSTLLFAVSTIIGWSYYGEVCVRYLFKGETAVCIYKLCYAAAVYVGAVSSIALVWGLADLLNGLMMIPNLIAVLMLSKAVSDETKRLDKYILFKKDKK